MAEPWCSQGFMPCSAKGFFESFLQFYKKKKNTARVFFSFVYLYQKRYFEVYARRIRTLIN